MSGAINFMLNYLNKHNFRGKATAKKHNAS
jgi:hypothetical protein